MYSNGQVIKANPVRIKPIVAWRALLRSNEEKFCCANVIHSRVFIFKCGGTRYSGVKFLG